MIEDLLSKLRVNPGRPASATRLSGCPAIVTAVSADSSSSAIHALLGARVAPHDRAQVQKGSIPSGKPLLNQGPPHKLHSELDPRELRSSLSLHPETSQQSRGHIDCDTCTWLHAKGASMIWGDGQGYIATRVMIDLLGPRMRQGTRPKESRRKARKSARRS